MSDLRRRDFLKVVGAFSAAQAFGMNPMGGAGKPEDPLTVFKLGCISDELTQNFEQALQIMKRFGLSWVEIRTLWGVYNTAATPQQVRRMKSLVERYRFKVSVIDTGVFKCVLPGTTPVSRNKRDYTASAQYAKQFDVLKHAIERAHQMGTDKVRVFSFWRVANPEAHYSQIADNLSKASEIAGRSGVRVLLEDENACNVGTGHELAKMLELVPASNFGVNWDVGNGYWLGEVSYPDGYDALPKDRIWHMHLKDARCAAGFKDCHTTVVGQGQINLLGQLRALLRNHYEGTMSLEPEFHTKNISHREGTERSMAALLKIMRRAVAQGA